MYDLLLSGGAVIDGTGKAATRADVGVVRGRIAAIGDLREVAAAKVLDLCGLVVAPGFIDLHTHADLTVLCDPPVHNAVHQGVTTIATGQCGASPFPVRPSMRADLEAAMPFFTVPVEWTWESTQEYLGALRQIRPGLNVVPFVGHSALRAYTVGLENRPLGKCDLQELETACRQAFLEGAGGLSFGLIYAPSAMADTEEMIRLGRIAAEFDRLCSVHIRGEDARLLGALQEAIELAEKSGARVEVSHLKAAGEPNWGQVARALEMIEGAVARNVRIGFDAYPYTAGSTHLAGLLPSWLSEGNWAQMARRLQDTGARHALREQAQDFLGSRHPRRIMITSVDSVANQSLVGKTVAEVARERGVSEIDCVVELILEEENHIIVVAFDMCEEDVEQVLAHPLGAVASDTLALASTEESATGRPHPRCYGTFPRVLGRYVREKGLLPLEEAVRKMTSLPAQRLGLYTRGVIAQDMAADLVVFDPERIMDRATYEQPCQYPEGIEHVIVNGEVVLEHGQHTGRRPGQVLTPANRTQRKLD